MTSERARAIILQYGWNSTAYQLLNPGFRHWYPAAGDAVVGFVAAGHTRVVGGAPVCASERLGGVAREFELDAAAAGERVCWLGAGARLADELSGAGHARARVGAQPWWVPASWSGIVAERASLRAQLNRAGNKGVQVAEWDGARAARSSALARCLEAWLAYQRLPPLHFLVEPDLLGNLLDRRIFVAEREGEPVGYLLLSPIPARTGWLVEQIVRSPLAPNGTTELLVDAAMRAAAADDSAYITLGVAPLSARAGPAGGGLWLRLALGWARAHGRRFYNFGGLEAFKAKFRPEGWEPAWLVTNDRSVRPRHLWAIAAVYAGGSPARTVVRALGRAVRDEQRRALASLRARRT